jgi:hypothetical protein
VKAPGKPAEQGQRRDARRSHAVGGRETEKKGKTVNKSSHRIYAPDGGIKSGETEKAWDIVPAWIGQARFLRTLIYESLIKRVRYTNVQRAR